MPTSPLSFRLDENLTEELRLQAEKAGRQLSTHISQIVEAHLSNDKPSASPLHLEQQSQIAQSLRQITEETQTLHRVFAQKSRENDADMQALISQVDELRTDLCTAFGALLEMLTDLDADAATAWARKFLKPPPRKA